MAKAILFRRRRSRCMEIYVSRFPYSEDAKRIDVVVQVNARTESGMKQV